MEGIRPADAAQGHCLRILRLRVHLGNRPLNVLRELRILIGFQEKIMKATNKTTHAKC